ncbi:iron-containing alcohol dehydrogenase [Clostridium sp.]|uniref:iron-containing alcohol dehydrogenase n=1 Tax=Clostridium sp. TaxID=1506 RepID=UPI002FC9BCB9
MLNFEFHNPTKIVFGKNTIEKLDALVPQNARVLVTYGGGSIKKNGVLDKVRAALKDRIVGEFGGIEPNPQFTTLIKAAEVVKVEKVDFLLAVGGGSVMDGTKFISLAATFNGENKLDLFNYGGVPVEVAPGIPIGTVVTLPATGSESNGGGVISSERGKLAIFSETSYPKFSILDPEATYSLPKTQVANGVIDTFIHTTEQYMTFPCEGRFQDRTSEGILKTLVEIGKFTIDNPTDYDARANLVWCATMGLNGLIGSGVPEDWATHMIGHEITNIFGVDHAKTLACIAPALWEVRREQKRAKLLQYAARVWHIVEGSEDERIDKAIAKTREFFNSLGVSTNLRDHGVTEDRVEEIIEGLKAHGMTSLSEDGGITPEVSREIILKAL